VLHRKLQNVVQVVQVIRMAKNFCGHFWRTECTYDASLNC